MSAELIGESVAGRRLGKGRPVNATRIEESAAGRRLTPRAGS